MHYPFELVRSTWSCHPGSSPRPITRFNIARFRRIIRHSHFDTRPIRHSYFRIRNLIFRSALETLAGPADASAIARLFKGARKDRIEAILESLQALGHAHEVEDGRYSA